MISPENKQILVDLGKTNQGKVLKEYLSEKYKELNSVLKVTSWEDTLGKQKALVVLKDLFSILDDEKKHDTMSSKSRYD